MSDIELFLLNSDFNLIGITGNAGAGKTSLTNKLDDSIFSKYSIDWRFIGDSHDRKKLLQHKASTSLSSYIDACNQFNWWDWDQISKDIDLLLNNNSITFNAYDRDSGAYNNVNFERSKRKLIIEGALLGPEFIAEKFDVIIFKFTPAQIRFNRILTKDISRRSLNEILARFLITEYSEKLHYNFLFNNFKERIFFINDNGDFISYPKSLESTAQFIPVPIT